MRSAATRGLVRSSEGGRQTAVAGAFVWSRFSQCKGFWAVWGWSGSSLDVSVSTLRYLDVGAQKYLDRFVATCEGPNIFLVFCVWFEFTFCVKCGPFNVVVCVCGE